MRITGFRKINEILTDLDLKLKIEKFYCTPDRLFKHHRKKIRNQIVLQNIEFSDNLSDFKLVSKNTSRNIIKYVQRRSTKKVTSHL